MPGMVPPSPVREFICLAYGAASDELHSFLCGSGWTWRFANNLWHFRLEQPKALAGMYGRVEAKPGETVRLTYQDATRDVPGHWVLEPLRVVIARGNARVAKRRANAAWRIYIRPDREMRAWATLAAYQEGLPGGIAPDGTEAAETVQALLETAQMCEIASRVARCTAHPVPAGTTVADAQTAWDAFVTAHPVPSDELLEEAVRKMAHLEQALDACVRGLLAQEEEA